MTNWESAIETAKAMDKDKLIADLLRYIYKMKGKRRLSLPLWSHVGEATSHGSTVSSAIVSLYLPEANDK